MNSLRLFHHYSAALFAAAILASLGACKTSQPTQAPVVADSSSYQLLQARIINQSCATAGCHVTGSQMATESGLVLEPAVAYQNLFGIAPANPNARADGLLRIKPFSADSSLFWHKLHFDAGHHAHDYGAPMPLGGKPLSDGQIEFVRQWINAGAPTTGNVADPILLNDTNHASLKPFTALAPPAPGAGFQMHIEPFSVQPFFEREMFVYKKVGNSSDIYVNKIQTKMRASSHHFVLYTFDPTTPKSIFPVLDMVRDIRAANGDMINNNMRPMEYHIFFGGSMTPEYEYDFPPGVAMKVPADAALDLNAHYVNRTDDTLTGEAYANLYTIAPEQVQHVASTLNLSNQFLSLPANKRTTVTTKFTFDTLTHIVMLTSHMHEHGELYQIKILGGSRNGEVIYENTDWASPLNKTFATPIVLNKGEGLQSVVTYNNTTSHNIGFGLTSEDEMNIIFGYVY